MDYNKLKNKLKVTGRSWAKELAETVGCSHNLVYQVCSGTKADRRGIIALALERIETYEIERKRQEQRLREIETKSPYAGKVHNP